MPLVFLPTEFSIAYTKAINQFINTDKQCKQWITNGLHYCKYVCKMILLSIYYIRCVPCMKCDRNNEMKCNKTNGFINVGYSPALIIIALFLIQQA